MSIFGAAMNTVGNLATTQMNIAHNKAMNESQQKHDKEMMFRSFLLNEQAAQRAQLREEDIYNRYKSPEALRRQYEAAGLNPALALSQMGGTVGSGGTGGASGAASSMGRYFAQNPIDMLGMEKAIEEIKNIKADTESKKTQTEKTKTDTQLTLQQILTEKNETERVSWLATQEQIKTGFLSAREYEEIRNIMEDTNLKSEEGKVARKRAAQIVAQTKTEWYMQQKLKSEKSLNEKQIERINQEIVNSPTLNGIMGTLMKTKNDNEKFPKTVDGITYNSYQEFQYKMLEKQLEPALEGLKLEQKKFVNQMLNEAVDRVMNEMHRVQDKLFDIIF